MLLVLKSMVLGTPPFTPQDPPKNTKSHQKASKGPVKEGAPGFARARNEKCDFGPENDGFGHPCILLQKGQESPSKPHKPRDTPSKSHQKASKGFKRPPKRRGNPRMPVPANKNAIFWY